MLSTIFFIDFQFILCFSRSKTSCTFDPSLGMSVALRVSINVCRLATSCSNHDVFYCYELFCSGCCIIQIGRGEKGFLRCSLTLSTRLGDMCPSRDGKRKHFILKNSGSFFFFLLSNDHYALHTICRDRTLERYKRYSLLL